MRVLETIHTNIYCPFQVRTIDGFDSFITFKDDYPRYDYIYPIKERLEALNKFKHFKAEVENQHNLEIKIVRLYHGRSITDAIHSMDKYHGLLQGS
jgi:hypothetical protein